MYVLWLFIITPCLTTAVLTKSCLEVKLKFEKECLDLDNYVDCVRTRMKRHLSECRYEDQCFECECEFCQYSLCGGECSDCCNSCCSNYVQCHTNHCCHKQCHSECRSYNCRSSCRKSCYESVSREKTERVDREVVERIVDRTIEKNDGTNDNLQSNTTNVNAHNITTVINLKNVINNTNLIDVPINLNYTNKNNISLTEARNPHSCSSNPSGGSSRVDCCIVIGPRQCFQIQVYPFVRCHYLRSKQCGSICTSLGTSTGVPYPSCTVNFVGQLVCEKEAPYIPQPQPRCTYSNMWPYVTCGYQPTASCDGCYGHYFSSQSKVYKSCSPECYNDLGAGPLNRQGPFDQPPYSDLPCYLSPQGCGGLGMMDAYRGGLGGYMGGPGQGFGGGFGYPAQLPMLHSPPFLPQQPIISLNSTIPSTNNKSSIEFSDKHPQPWHARHLRHNQKTGPIPTPLRGNGKEHTPITIHSHPAHRELVDDMVIDQYQTDNDRSLAPVYELPDQEVEIDIKIIDPNKTLDIKLPFMDDIVKEQNKAKK